MGKIMAVLETVNGWVNNFVWGVPVLLLILGTGIFYTIRLGPAIPPPGVSVQGDRRQGIPEKRQPGA